MDVPAELIVRIGRRDRASVGFRYGRLLAVAALLCRGVGSVISPGTATQRRGYNISEAMVRVVSCCCSRLALSRRWPCILPGTATQRRGYNISEAMVGL